LKDRKIKIVFLILIFLITYLPLIAAQILTPKGYTFTGFIAGGVDYYTFLTKLKLGYLGNWIYTNKFTTENIQGVPIYFFYIVLGHIGKLFNISPIKMLLYSDMIIAIVSWSFLLWYLRNETIYSYIFSMFLFPYPFLKFFMWPSAYSAVSIPHYGIDIIGLLLVIEGFKRKKYILGIAGAYLLLIIHPFLLALAYLIPVIYAALYEKDKFKYTVKYLFLLTISISPYLIVLLKYFTQTEWLKEWREQALANYNPLLLILVYGIPMYLAVYYVLKNYRKLDKEEKFSTAWIISAIILTFLMPMTNKDEFLFMFSLPVGILAGRFLDKFTLPRDFLIFLSVLMIALNILVVFTTTYKAYEAVHGNFTPDYTNLYLPNAYLDAFYSMKDNGNVLSRYYTGNMIPFYSKNKVYVGHLSETMNFTEKKSESDKFFDRKMSNSRISELIQNNDIKYIVFDNYLYKDKPFNVKGFYKIFENKYATVLERR